MMLSVSGVQEGQGRAGCGTRLFLYEMWVGPENSDEHRGELRGSRQKKGSPVGAQRVDAAQMTIYSCDGRCHGGTPF